MTLLVLLLSVFLFIRWQRSSAGPLVVKEPPPPVSTKAPDDLVNTPPIPVVEQPPPPPPPQDDEKRRRYATLVVDARLAVDEKRWDDAGQKIAQARELVPDGKELQELADALAAARKAEAARKEEERRKRDAAFAEAREKVQKFRDQDRWDSAVETLEKLERDHPALAQVEEFQTLLRDIRRFHSDADRVYRQRMAEAEKALAEGRFQEALSLSQRALSLVKDRETKVRFFQERVNQLLLERTMVRVPSASCRIGGEEEADERPVRPVKLPAFLIDKYEVTNDEYYAFMLATGHPAPRSPYWPGGRPVAGRERHPVVYVAASDAEAYAKWAGKRLPTAEEWEVAARGIDQREYPWGSAFSEQENVLHANTIAWWELRKGTPTTTPVDATDSPNSPSPWGVCGMAGNVWEWTSTEVERARGRFRILKGGSFLSKAKAVRCANNYPEDPALGHPDVGFRCVKEIR
jgi:formylglycine-generating enzyme required for sulfatase activity